MTLSATNIVAPVLATTEVVVLLLARVAGKTGLGSFFGRLVLERNDLRRIAFLYVGLAWPMARFAASYLSFPTADRGKFGVRCMGEGFELIFVTVLAGFAADIISGDVGCRFGLARFERLGLASLGRLPEAKPT